MKLIDKDALVAEIKKRLLPVVRDKHYDEWEMGEDSERLAILNIIDTLEVKEVEEQSMDKVEKIKTEIKRRKSLEDKEKDNIYFFARSDAYAELLNFIDSLEEEPDCMDNHTPNNSQITIGRGTKLRSKTNPDVILNIISDDCHEDEFECSNGSVLSLKQIEKYYDPII